MEYGNKISEITELTIMDIRKAFHFMKDGFDNIKSRFEEAKDYENEFKYYIDVFHEDPSILEEKTPRGERFRDAKEKLYIVSSMYKFAFDQQEIAYRMTHVFIISVYEAAIKQLFKIALNEDPKLLADDRSIIDALSEEEKANKIKKKLDKIANVDKLHVFMQRKFEVDISNFSGWVNFKESFYRRHVIVHNHGIYDEKYQRNTHCHASLIRTKIKTDFGYIEKLHENTIQFIGYLRNKILTRFGWGIVGKGTSIDKILDTIRKKGAM